MNVRIIAVLLFSCMGGCATNGSDTSVPGYSAEQLRRIDLWQMTIRFTDSDAVFIAKGSARGGRLLFTCIDIWKAKDGNPHVGQVIEIPGDHGLREWDGEGLVFLPKYPAISPGYWFRGLSSDGHLLTNKLSLAEIKETIRIPNR